MKRLALFTLTLLVFACGGAMEPFANRENAGKEKPKPPSPSEIAEGNVESQALGVHKRYRVYLPTGYKTTTDRYPVFYLMHGLGGNEDSWDKMGVKAAADAENLNALIIMPDGDDGFYSDWATKTEDFQTCLDGKAPFESGTDMRTYCVQTRSYETYITRDLIEHVDQTYRTKADRHNRAIGGVSMGGFGSLYLAFKHPDLFSIVAAHSPVASVLFEGPIPYKKGKSKLSRNPKKQLKGFGPEIGPHIGKVLGNDLKNWRAHDPTSMVTSLDKTNTLSVYMDCGTEDEFKLQHGSQYLAELLKLAGVEAELHLESGKHDVPFFESRIDDSIRFVAAGFSK